MIRVVGLPQASEFHVERQDLGLLRLDQFAVGEFHGRDFLDLGPDLLLKQTGLVVPLELLDRALRRLVAGPECPHLGIDQIVDLPRAGALIRSS